MPGKMIKALLVRVNENPEVIEIENTLKPMQDAVGGLVQCVWLSDSAVLLCNEEGKLRGLPDNRQVGPHTIQGDFLIVGDEGTEDWESLSEEDIKKYTESLSFEFVVSGAITAITNKKVVDGLNMYFENNEIDPNEIAQSYEGNMEYAKKVFKDMVDVFKDRSVKPTLEELNELGVDTVMVPAVFQSIDTGKICIGVATIDLQSSGEHCETQILTKYGFENQYRYKQNPNEEVAKMFEELIPYRYYYLPEYSGDIHIDRKNISKEIQEFIDYADEPEMNQGMGGLELS